MTIEIKYVFVSIVLHFEMLKVSELKIMTSASITTFVLMQLRDSTDSSLNLIARLTQDQQLKQSTKYRKF